MNTVPATNTVYACTYMDKTATEDNFETGCDPSSCITVTNQRCSLRSINLSDLLLNISTHFGIDIDNVFISEDDDNNITLIGYNRLENSQGDEPTDREIKLWKEGKQNLFLCDYTFSIEKRIIIPITIKDFEDEGIKHH
jgi:hypothetical protein